MNSKAPGSAAILATPGLPDRGGQDGRALRWSQQRSQASRYRRGSALTSSGLIRSGTVQPLRSYSPRQESTNDFIWSANPIAWAIPIVLIRVSSVEPAQLIS